MLMRRAALGCTILALAGCGAASPRVLTATDTQVSYSWDSSAATVADISSRAKSYCGKLDKTASLVSNSAASRTGTFFVTTFDCVSEPKQP